jgi:hypothetical protein
MWCKPLPVKNKNAESLTDAQLRQRLEATSRNPVTLEKWFKRGIQVLAIGGIIAGVLAAGALGLGSIGEIGFVLLVAAGIVTGSVLHRQQQDKWEVENRTLRFEEQVRPGRMQRMAKSLKEDFIAAMTGGTKQDVKIGPPLKLKSPKPEA